MENAPNLLPWVFLGSCFIAVLAQVVKGRTGFFWFLGAFLGTTLWREVVETAIANSQVYDWRAHAVLAVVVPIGITAVGVLTLPRKTPKVSSI